MMGLVYILNILLNVAVSILFYSWLNSANLSVHGADVFHLIAHGYPKIHGAGVFHLIAHGYHWKHIGWQLVCSRTTIKSRCLILHQVAFIVVLYWIRSWTLEQRSTVKSSGHDGSALGQDTSSTLPSPLKGTSSCRSRGASSCHVK